MSNGLTDLESLGPNKLCLFKIKISSRAANEDKVIM